MAKWECSSIISTVAFFVVLTASLEGPKKGNNSAQVYLEHPSTRGMGAEADDSPYLKFDKRPHKR